MSDSDIILSLSFFRGGGKDHLISIPPDRLRFHRSDHLLPEFGLQSTDRIDPIPMGDGRS